MKKLSLLLLIFVFVSCGDRNRGESDAEIADLEQTDDVFTQDVQEYIVELSDLDCRLYTLLTEAMGKKEYEQYQDQILELRNEKRSIIEKITSLNSDSAHLAAVNLEIKRLSEQEDYCPGLKALQVRENPTDPNGVPAKPLHIRDDAEKLADMNCRIMEAHKKVDPTRSKRVETPELRKLLSEKRAFLNELMVMYGPEVISGEMFRMLVLEAQEKSCNYVGELKAAESLSAERK